VNTKIHKAIQEQGGMPFITLSLPERMAAIENAMKTAAPGLKSVSVRLVGRTLEIRANVGQPHYFVEALSTIDEK